MLKFWSKIKFKLKIAFEIILYEVFPKNKVI